MNRKNLQYGIILPCSSVPKLRAPEETEPGFSKKKDDGEQEEQRLQAERHQVSGRKNPGFFSVGEKAQIKNLGRKRVKKPEADGRDRVQDDDVEREMGQGRQEKSRSTSRPAAQEKRQAEPRGQDEKQIMGVTLMGKERTPPQAPAQPVRE